MERTRQSGAAVAIVFAMLMALPIYVLSIGPAVRLYSFGYISDSTYRTVYWPVFVVAANVPLVQKPLAWYVGLWRPPAFVG